MSTPLLFDAVLCLLLVGTALCAAGVRDLFAAIVLFINYGLFVAVAWVRLGSVDVALAEAAIGAGLTGVLLVRAAGRLEKPSARADREPAWTRLSWAGLFPALPCFAVSGALAWIVLGASLAVGGLRNEVASNLSATGVSNPVTAVLLVFRGYDTLLETVVLLAALIAVWSVTPDSLWGGPPGVREHARPEGVLASFGRLLPPIGLMVGIHLFWAGAEAPGGAFQAGTVLAAVWLLAVMASLADVPPVSSGRLRFVVAVGPMIFLVLAVAGVAAGSFLVFPPDYAKAMILTIEAALTMSIAATLALLVMGPPGRIT